MGDADRRLRFVDVLAARPGRAVGVDPQVLRVDLDLGVRLLQLGHDLNQRERGVPAVILVEGRDSHQAVDAMLGPEQAVRSRAGDQKRRPFQARLLSRRGLQHLGLETAPLSPLEVHAHQHLHPVLGIDAACPRADREDRIVRGIRIGEEEVELERPELAFDLRPLALQLGHQLGIFEPGQLDQVAGPGLQARPTGDLFAELRRLPPVASGLRRVVPDPGLG